MDASKRFQTNLSLIIVFSYLIIFPFGQLLTIPLDLFGKRVDINLADLIIFLSVPIYYLHRYHKSFKYFTFIDFLVVCGFSLLFSLNYFTTSQIVIGTLYFIRLVSYSYFFLVLYNLVINKYIKKDLLLNSLLALSVATAIFGWIQYLLMPDLTFLKYLNWDDHLYRLVGTFLDPAFTALIIVFGVIISIIKKYKYSIYQFFTTSFLIISLVFTYSRASYLALVCAIVFLVLKKYSKNWKLFALIGVVIISAFLVLPRKSSEGTLLERTQSIYAKLNNYSETVKIIKKYPVFGIGFNNLCEERIKTFGGFSNSHACSGADSSLLFILATTGVIGLLIFINAVSVIVINTSKDIYGVSFLSCLVALFVHSLFVQSVFYPFIMGYMAIHHAISVAKE